MNINNYLGSIWYTGMITAGLGLIGYCSTMLIKELINKIQKRKEEMLK